ncbi:NHL repeat-containing protein [bacterium]|nr:NHL repeat-containing protein [bacterium]
MAISRKRKSAKKIVSKAVKKNVKPTGAKKAPAAAEVKPAAKRVKKAVTKKFKSVASAKKGVKISRPPLSAKVKEKKKGEGAQKKNRGLIVFGVIVGVIISFAVIGKLRQGPPIKLLPVTVEARFTMSGHQDGPLASPRGIALDSGKNLYVADLGNHRVVKFLPDGSVGGVWGKQGTHAGEFKEPSGVAIDNQGDVYVADTWNGRIQKFSNQGEYYGEITSKTGNFYSPRNVAVDTNGFIYVSDTGNSCVKKFDVDANLVKRWGEYGTGRDRFQETFGLCSGPDNLIYVGDAGNRKIKVYSSDGKFIQEVRIKGWQSGVGWPMMAVDKAGTVYATDVQHNMVWIYNKEGKYIGSWGNKPGKDFFVSPLGIAVDDLGSVYVSNMNKGEIIKIAPIQTK